MTGLRFWVPGHAQTAGSKVAVPIGAGRRRVVESGNRPAKSAWRADLRAAAAEAVGLDGGEWPCDGPLVVEFRFVRARPAAHYGTGRNAGALKAWAAPMRPTGRPDVLKLARAAEDALTGVLWTDDARIVEERLVKLYPDQGGHGRHEAGVEVAVRRLEVDR